MNSAYLLTAISDPLLKPDVEQIIAATSRPLISLEKQLAHSQQPESLVQRHAARAAAFVVDSINIVHTQGRRTHDHLYVVVRDDEEIPWEAVLAAHAEQVFHLPAQSSDLLAELARLPDISQRHRTSDARGVILGVTASAGGAGSSTFALSLARQLPNTVLIDGVDGSGGLDLLCGIEDSPGARWPELSLDSEGNLDAQLLCTALPSDSQGVAVLSAARSTIADPFRLKDEDIVRVARCFAEGGYNVVIDLPQAALMAWESPLLHACDHMTVLAVAQVRPIAATVAIMARLREQAIRCDVLLRHRDWSGLNREDAQAVLGEEVLAEIPHLGKLARMVETTGLRDIPGPLRKAAQAILEVAR